MSRPRRRAEPPPRLPKRLPPQRKRTVPRQGPPRERPPEELDGAPEAWAEGLATPASLSGLSICSSTSGTGRRDARQIHVTAIRCARRRGRLHVAMKSEFAPVAVTSHEGPVREPRTGQVTASSF